MLRIQVRENALDVHSVTDVAAASNGLFQVDVHKAELELLVRVLQRLLHVRYVQIPFTYMNGLYVFPHYLRIGACE